MRGGLLGKDGWLRYERRRSIKEKEGLQRKKRDISTKI